MHGELLEAIFRGEIRETRNIEFKKSYTWSLPEHRHKIVKTALALSNIRDGGYLILGVEDRTGTPVGMDESDYDLLDNDRMSAEVNRFADPFVELNLLKIEKNFMKFAIIRVSEFSVVPVICKSQGEANLRQGTIYTRAHRIPETIAVPTQTEMREIIELAVDKGIRHFQARQERQRFEQPEPNDARNFEDELGGL